MGVSGGPTSFHLLPLLLPPYISSSSVIELADRTMGLSASKLGSSRARLRPPPSSAGAPGGGVATILLARSELRLCASIESRTAVIFPDALRCSNLLRLFQLTSSLCNLVSIHGPAKMSRTQPKFKMIMIEPTLISSISTKSVSSTMMRSARIVICHWQTATKKKGAV